MHPHILLLTTPSSYRLEAFLRAAERLGVAALVAEDAPAALAGRLGQHIGLDFNDTARAVADIMSIHVGSPLAAVIAVDDSGALVAARASAALGLPHNRPEAAEAEIGRAHV